jgi:hypothetical protein
VAFKPQHTLPLDYNTFVTLCHTSYGGLSSPLFEGHVREIQPTASNEVTIRCYSPDARAGAEVAILSDPSVWSTAVPYVVYNVTNEQDPDRAFEWLYNATTGEILKDLLDTAATDLAAINAGIGANPYLAADFAAMDAKPQDKVVFAGARIVDGLRRLIQMYPNIRLLWEAGTRYWRFIDTHVSPETTITLNGESASGCTVLSANLQRNLEGRYSAVEIYGPPVTVTARPSKSGGGLTELWDATAGTQFTLYGPTLPGTADVGRRWQIADTTKRRMARLLPEYEPAPVVGGFGGLGTFLTVNTKEPTLQVTYGNGIWETIPNCTYDYRNGIVTAPMSVYRKKDGTSADYTLPTDVKLVYAYYGDPLKARYPTSSYEGGVFDLFGLQTTLREYDPFLAVGYDTGTPVTSAERLAQYQKLAEALHKYYSSAIVTGPVLLEGYDWDFLKLDKRVNLAANDGSGGTITTNWEAAKLIATAVTYDFTECTTTVELASEQAEYMQADMEVLKHQMRIRPTEYLLYSAANFFGGQWNYSRDLLYREAASDYRDTPEEYRAADGTMPTIDGYQRDLLNLLGL